MGASPVIIDDGGSTRIKRLVSGTVKGVMDSLLDVDEIPPPPRSTHTADGPFTNVKITYITRDGTPGVFYENPLLVPLVAGDSFTVVSNHGQQVTLLIDPTNHCVITVIGQLNNPPQMDVKVFKKKRRYLVTNAGPIASISGVVRGVTIPPFDARTAGSVYTTLVLSGI